MADLPDKYRALTQTPRVGLANFYLFQPGEIVGPYWTKSDFYLPVLRGTGEIRVRGERYQVRAGQIVHAPWTAPVHILADARDPFLLIGVHLVYLPWDAPAASIPRSFTNADMEKTALETPPVPMPISDIFRIEAEPDDAVIAQARDIVLCYENTAQSADMREAELRARAFLFIREVQRLHAIASSASAHPQAGLVKMLEAWIEANYARPVKRSDLAARVRMSESLLAQAFLAVLGQPPIDYLIDVRLKHARRLLLESRLSIGEVAREVGIEDIYYFSKLFKKRLGMPPRRYRDRFRF